MTATSEVAPTAFIEEMTKGLSAIGVPSDQVFHEVFGSGPELKPGIVNVQQSAPHAPVGMPGNGPLVSFARSGLERPLELRLFEHT